MHDKNIEDYRAQRRDMLFAAFLAKQAQGAATRRRTPRVQISMPLTLHMDEWETDTETLDLSEGGYSFFSSQPPAQEIVPFKLELEPRRYVRGHARVVAHVKSGSRYRISVAFARLEANAHAAISDRLLDAMEAHISQLS